MGLTTPYESLRLPTLRLNRRAAFNGPVVVNVVAMVSSRLMTRM